MAKHIVLFQVKEGEDKDQVARTASEVLEPLCGKIPGLLYAEVERCTGGADFVLYAELEDMETLAAYAEHPLHVAAKSQFFHLISSRCAVDYEV